MVEALSKIAKYAFIVVILIIFYT